MSGIKVTDVLLEAKANLLLEVSGDKADALNRVQSLLQRLGDLLQGIEGVTAGDSAVAEKLKSYQDRLKQEEVSLNTRQRDLDRIELPGAAKDADTDRLNESKGAISRINEKNGATAGLFEEVNSNIINLKTADKTMARIESALQNLAYELQSQGQLLERWLPEEHRDLLETKESVTAALEKQRGAIDASESPDGVTRELGLIEETAGSLSGDIKRLGEETVRREKLQQKRVYVLKGLRNTCAYLGFKEVGGPDYDNKEDRNSPVVQTFDTINRGLITFRLTLDGRIDSNSGMSDDVCTEEFSRLAEFLAQEYGIQTEFKHPGHDDLPERLTSTEKPVPRRREPKRMER